MLVIDIDNRLAYYSPENATVLKTIKKEKLDKAFLIFNDSFDLAELLTLEEMSDTWSKRNPDVNRTFENEDEAADWLMDDHKDFPKLQKKHLYIEFKPPESAADLAGSPKPFRIAQLQKAEVELVPGNGTARSPRHKLILEEATEWGSLNWVEVVDLFDNDEKLAGKVARGAVRRDILKVKEL